jgi:thiamine-phosphate diphosphorylase
VRDAAEAAAAAGEGADYVFLGTIFSTPSHPGDAGMGLEGLAAVTTRVKALADAVPVIAIGGIDPARAGDVLDAGAHGIAVVRGVWDSRDAAEAVRSYRERVAEAVADRRT